MRCIPNIQNFSAPLKATIQTCFLPNLTGQPSFNDIEHKLFALPAHLGGLGIVDPPQYSVFQFSALVPITAPGSVNFSAALCPLC